MARGRQLLQLVSMLREEVGRASSVAVGVEDLPGLKTKLRRTQEVLYDDYDWPHLRQIFDAITMSAGERYYDFPAEMNFERIEDVEGVVVWWNGRPQTLDKGVSFREYAMYDSNEDVRSEPILKWDVRWTGTATQFEVWPMPSTNTQMIQFDGIRKLRTLVSDSDVADLDDQLIVLTTAAELLGKSDKQAAAGLASLAASRYARLKGRMAAGRKRYRIGMGAAPDKRPTVVVRAN